MYALLDTLFARLQRFFEISRGKTLDLAGISGQERLEDPAHQGVSPHFPGNQPM
jgi:hypothetical protein